MFSLTGINTKIGESPIWKNDTQSVVWIEAAGQEVFEYFLENKTVQRFRVPFDITAIALCDNGHWLCASKQGLYYCSSRFDQFAAIADPCANTELLHLNDAVASPTGQLWFGSMNFAQLEAPDGQFFQLTDNGILTMDSGFSVANGIAFNPTLKRAYCSNMFQRKVYEYQLDDTMSQILDKSVFVEFDESLGFPDGLCVDASGNLYVCHWEGGIISYYAPSTNLLGDANMLGQIDLPVKHATRCTFGGPEFKTLFVTTADFELSDEEAKCYPQSGELLILDAPTLGQPENRVNSALLNNWQPSVEPLTS